MSDRPTPLETADEPDTGRGSLTFTEAPGTSGGPDDVEERFAAEERRMILVVMVPQDAPGLVAALGREGIGASIGARTDDGGVEVLVHDANLPEAQAILIEYTGDESLADYVVEASEGWGDPSQEMDDGFVRLAAGPASDMSQIAGRLREAGIDVIVSPPALDPPGFVPIGGPTAVIGVREERLDEARRVAGIEA
jgi:hypothetical protein